MSLWKTGYLHSPEPGQAGCFAVCYCTDSIIAMPPNAFRQRGAKLFFFAHRSKLLQCSSLVFQTTVQTDLVSARVSTSCRAARAAMLSCPAAAPERLRKADKAKRGMHRVKLPAAPNCDPGHFLFRRHSGGVVEREQVYQVPECPKRVQGSRPAARESRGRRRCRPLGRGKGA